MAMNNKLKAAQTTTLQGNAVDKAIPISKTINVTQHVTTYLL